MVLGLHHHWRRVRDGLFSRFAAGGFASFGKQSHLSLPVTVHRADLIAIGRGVYFGPGCWLQALPTGDAREPGTIGLGFSIGRFARGVGSTSMSNHGVSS